MVVLFLLFGAMENCVQAQLQSRASILGYAILSSLFLISDILLPIPSSLIMILNGKILGIMMGTVVSLLSGLVSSTIGFFLGRISSPVVDKYFSESERRSGNDLISRFGSAAIIISRALPVLSEAVSVVAGTTTIEFRQFLIGSAVGHLIVSLGYAAMGRYLQTMNSNLLAGMLISAVFVVAWIVHRLSKNKLKSQAV